MIDVCSAIIDKMVNDIVIQKLLYGLKPES